MIIRTLCQNLGLGWATGDASVVELLLWAWGRPLAMGLWWVFTLPFYTSYLGYIYTSSNPKTIER